MKIAATFAAYFAVMLLFSILARVIQSWFHRRKYGRK